MFQGYSQGMSSQQGASPAHKPVNDWMTRARRALADYGFIPGDDATDEEKEEFWRPRFQASYQGKKGQAGMSFLGPRSSGGGLMNIPKSGGSSPIVEDWISRLMSGGSFRL